MRAELESLTHGHQLYSPRRAEFRTTDLLPFRVSPEPLRLSSEQLIEIRRIGVDIVSFVKATSNLYDQQEDVQAILNTGKPEILCGLKNKPNYLFLRPDLIMTDVGFTVCEIETSPFGLGLAHLLNSGYEQAGFETGVEADTLPKIVQGLTSPIGTLLYSNKTEAYTRQLEYVAKEIFGRLWRAKKVDEKSPSGEIYRAFYLAEYMEDPLVQRLIASHAESQSNCITPSLTPYLEEKAILAFLWDKRWEEYYEKQLGTAAFQHLRRIVPPTWIVGQESHFAPGLPNGIQDSVQLGSIPKSQREYVLKCSGFHPSSSWGEGVTFLHKKSGKAVTNLLHAAESKKDTLYVVQEFHKPSKVQMSYEGATSEAEQVLAGVRITPYFLTVDGSLLTIKATGCVDTEFIHATTASINTAVGQ